MKGILYHLKTDPTKPIVRLLTDKDQFSEISYEIESDDSFAILPRVLTSSYLKEKIREIRNTKYLINKECEIDPEKFKDYFKSVDEFLSFFD